MDYFYKTILVSTAFSTVCLTLPLYADSTIVIESYNLFTAKLEKEIASVTTGNIRIEKPEDSQTHYQIIDLDEKKTYLINASDNSVIVDDLQRPSDYQDKATLVKVGGGPVLLDGQATTHYVFKAGEISCSHIDIAPIQNPDIHAYLESFNMVPVKVEGMIVQPEEKACQKSARDAASKIKALGVPLLIKNKDNQEVLFAIKEVARVENFPASTFEIKNKQSAQSADAVLKQGFEDAMQEVVYEKFMQELDKQDMPITQKRKIRGEATAAYEKGNFIGYLESMGSQEPLSNDEKIKMDKKPAVFVLSETPQRLPITQLAGYHISAGSQSGKDHAIYQMKYEAMKFDCKGQVTVSLSSDQHNFDTKKTGGYKVNGNSINYYDDDQKEGDASNSLVGLIDNHVVVGKSRFEGPEGLAVKDIRKVIDCPEP